MKSAPGQKNVEGPSGKKDGGLKIFSISYCCGWLLIHMSWRDGKSGELPTFFFLNIFDKIFF